MSDLFKLPKELPKHIEEVSIYKTSHHKRFSYRNEAVVKEINQRIEKYGKFFKVERKPKDTGDTLVFRNRGLELEVYKNSHSFWMTNRRLAYRERLPRGVKLISEKQAVKKAEAFLESYEINMDNAAVVDINYTETIIDRPERESQHFKTAINVIYNFTLDDVPVVGPGAKVEMSFVGEELCEALYFWRTPEKVTTLPTMKPNDVLRRYTRDRRFRNLSEKNATVVVHSMDLGYLAIAPNELQQYLIPVYEISATVATKEAGELPFESYALALDMSSDKIKEHGYFINPGTCQIH